MTIEARSGDSYLPGMSGGAGRHGQRKGLHVSGATAASVQGAKGVLAGLGCEGSPRAALAAPQVIGSLLIASCAGFIGCVAALIVETSVWQSLAVYALTGTSVFAFLLTVQSGLQPAD